MRVITGSARGVRLKTPDGMQTRPTADRVKEAIFSIIQFEIEGRRVLDLFAGTGQLGIEALSRGAEHAVFVDARREAVALVRENLKRTRLSDRAETVQGDYLDYLSRCRQTFDVILLDPPYAEVFLETALQKISEIDILSDGGIIICESEREEQIPEPARPGYTRREYRYGKIKITAFEKNSD